MRIASFRAGRPAALGAAVVLGSLMAPAAAWGYCFVINDPAHQMQDFSVCQGDRARALSWRSSCVSVSVNPTSLPTDIRLDDLRAEVHLAMATWNAVRCADGGRPSLQFEPYPDSSASFGFDRQGTNANVFGFRRPWPSDALHTMGSPIVMRVEYIAGDSQTYDFDVDLNPDSPIPFSITAQRGRIELRTVALRSLGMMAGLAPSLVEDSLMHGATRVRHTLAQDDIDGFCALYPPGRSAECDAEPFGGFDGPGCYCAVPRPAPCRRGPALALAGLALLAARRRRSPAAGAPSAGRGTGPQLTR